MTLPFSVETPRLSLPLWTREDIDQLCGQGRAASWHADFPRQDDRDTAALWTDGDTWGPRSIVLSGQVIGSIGFFGPPEPRDHDGYDEAEVGYGLVEGAQGMGIATEARQALLTETDKLRVQVRASVEPDNAASIRVLVKAGFTHSGTSTNDRELILVRPAA